MAKKKKNELATVDVSEYPILAGNDAVNEVIKQNLGGEEVTAADFTRIKVPSGGGTQWIVPTLSGGGEMVDELEGIILFSTRRRGYWKDSNPNGQPPDCGSSDMVTGVGEPGGACGMHGKIPCCPHNEFDSAEKGTGKACREGRLLFMLRQGNTLPDLIVAPPASLKAMRQYLLRIGQAGSNYWAVITALALEGKTNIGGTDYARIVPRLIGTLDESAAAKVLAVVRQYEVIFSGVGLEQDSGPQVEPVEI